MLNRLKQAWKRDRLGVLGIGAAVVALVLWSWPLFGQYREDCTYEDKGDLLIPISCKQGEFMQIDLITVHPTWLFRDDRNFFLFQDGLDWVWFPFDRLPVAATVLALAFILLLLRRR